MHYEPSWGFGHGVAERLDYEDCYRFIALLLALTIPPVHAAFLVLPNGFANTVANDSSGNIGISFPSGDFQEHLGTSQFASLGGPC